MKMKLLALNFQRNGVGGECFFVALVHNLTDVKGKFLITFDTEEKDEEETINYSSCRVVMIEGRDNCIYECWRGDRISDDISSLINDEMKKAKVKRMIHLGWHLQQKQTKIKNSCIEYVQ